MAPRVPAILCSEGVATLHLLHPIPAQPSSNPVTNVQSRAAGYTLSFEKERYLAGTLAFLAYPKDDNNRIPAVCVEEAPNSKYLNILLAINKAGGDEGRQALEELKNGFEKIFSHLARADNSSLDVENEVFESIISMCSRRILHRLRLRPSGQGQSIKEALQVALDYLRHTTHRGTKNAQILLGLDLFIERARVVLKLIHSWANHQLNPHLAELVEGICHLWQAGNLRSLIDTIPNEWMTPSLRDHLLNMIGKVATYRYAARFLFRLSKKTPLARRMRVVPVNLPAEAFGRVLATGNKEYEPKLEVTVSSIEGLKKKNRDLAQICRLLEKTERNAKTQFADQTRRTLREAKIHAEIQLLYYCELKSSRARLPRVVCSSKDACWLCNEFILMYEKIHMPKTHGRLYPGWRLPMLRGPGFDDFAKRYNQRLQGQMRESLKELVARGKRVTYPDPNESTLLDLPWSTSTLSLVPSLKDAIVEDVREVTPSSEEVSIHGPASPSEEESAHEPVVPDKEEIKPSPAEVEAAPSEAPDDDEKVDTVSEISSMPSSPDISTSETSSSSSGDLMLEQGKARSKGIRAGKETPLYVAGPLEIQVEYVGGSNLEIPDRRRKRLSCAFEWLNPDDAARLRDRQDSPVISAALLEGEIDHDADHDGCIYIASGDAVMRIVMRPMVVGPRRGTTAHT
ncbi:hypothetical protein GGR54DRAFT_312779 [Hypoxylon sp. NC1633]|nr:hypothetical protein GGR54DRAFT_312779 [Hypoxylon sp. NC1633]